MNMQQNKCKVVLLGATGSIGSSSLQVIRENKECFELYAASAYSDAEGLYRIIKEFAPKRVCLTCSDAADALYQKLKAEGINTEILTGVEGKESLCADAQGDFIINAIVGAAGLRPVLKAVERGANIGLANKECLVMAGEFFFDKVKEHKARIYPIDSEHSAIFQCLPPKEQQRIGFCRLKEAGVHKLLLTGSGGPFRTLPLDALKNVTVKMALSHPTWSMGPKITIDSATMMNKGLEFIEARCLFNAAFEDIEILVHPQSIVHSMISYIDGAVLAQLGVPDMKTPIACALGHPKRIPSGAMHLDFKSMGELAFSEPDFKRYPCLKLALEASKEGQGATCILNAANEVAVEAFLQEQISYLQIRKIISEVLEKVVSKPSSIDEIFESDRRARECASSIIKDML